MAIKTFSIEEDVYARFSKTCKENGISMSKQVEFFMRSMVEEPHIRKEYAEKLERIRKGQFVKVKSFSERYG
jgi:antitoxin component of RelBE/YafQ-DinJ toxin-antitoxin module